MSSGGARARSGPAPNPNSVRGARGEWVSLPVEGRRGRVPVWPFPDALSEWGVKEWRRLWRLPQAVMWERLDMQVQVAVYVKTLDEVVHAERAQANVLGQLQRMETSLGITVAGMHANRWKIADAAAVESVASVVSSVVDIRDRFQV